MCKRINKEKTTSDAARLKNTCNQVLTLTPSPPYGRHNIHPPFLGVMRFSMVCPGIPISTGATTTTTSEIGEGEYIGGVSTSVIGEVEHEEESEGESEGESIDPRERLSAGCGRAMPPRTPVTSRP